MKDKVIFALTTGLRDANVRELRWEEVDLQNRMVTIDGVRMKNGKPLSIPLNDTAYDVVWKRFRAKDRNTEWVFAYGGKPVQRSNTKAFRNALRELGSRTSDGTTCGIRGPHGISRRVLTPLLFVRWVAGLMTGWFNAMRTCRQSTCAKLRIT